MFHVNHSPKCRHVFSSDLAVDGANRVPATDAKRFFYIIPRLQSLEQGRRIFLGSATHRRHAAAHGVRLFVSPRSGLYVLAVHGGAIIPAQVSGLNVLRQRTFGNPSLSFKGFIHESGGAC